MKKKAPVPPPRRFDEVVLPDGTVAPLVPYCTFSDDYMDFDRTTCLAGIKRYVRHATMQELECLPPGEEVSFVLVEEIAPGIRYRITLA